MNNNYSSWGLTGQKNTDVRHIQWRKDKLPVIQEGNSLLPYGNGRSYGDSCLNIDGITLDTRSLNHFISFDPTTCFLRCESGVLITDLLLNFAPKGWFVHVTPGTKYITIGGAIANDVHGKNHHRRGSFANHVIRLALLRSNGETIICSHTQHSDLFFATIGGLGLTGLIVWADIMLMPIASKYLQVETTRFDSLEQFFELSTESELKYEYTVAWLDCASKNLMGRGIFMRANHCSGTSEVKKIPSNSSANIPFNFPGFLVNNITSKLFNSIYFNKHPRGIVEHVQDYDQFFYPLDKIRNWNRIYGKKGLFQYQCVVPIEQSKKKIEAILEGVDNSEVVSSLAVLKVFGEIESLGLMSFPRNGVTLAMDFPNRGTAVLDLLDRLDNIVADAGGAVYPAKDARMSAEHFRTFFPEVDKFKDFIDPVFSSTFWRRVMG